MRKHLGLAAVAAIALGASAPALASPNRIIALDPDHPSLGWTSAAGTGFLLDNLVSSHAPCTQVAQSCDFTLIKVGGTTPGTLTVSTSGNDQTLRDLDAWLYISDADGTQGDQLAAGTGSTPSEAVSSEVDPGYYLVKAAWMAGYGSYSGLAQFTPDDPTAG